jgi:hypothetical protein
MKQYVWIAGLSVVILMSGCAKKSEAPSADMAAESMAAPAVSANSPAVASAENPQELLATDLSALEQSRQLVKTSRLSFEVKDIQKTTMALQQKLLALNGYIESKQVDYQVADQQSRQKLDGTVTLFEKIVPTTQMTVRVPNQQVTAFLNDVLPLMTYFNQQQYEAKRYELKLLEEKINTAAQTAGVANNTSNQLQRLTQLEVQDRLQYSTITLDFFQAAQLRQRQDINIQRVAQLHSDPLLARLGQSLKMGFIGLRECVVWLVMLWPLLLLVAAGAVVYRIVKKSKQ